MHWQMWVLFNKRQREILVSFHERYSKLLFNIDAIKEYINYDDIPWTDQNGAIGTLIHMARIITANLFNFCLRWSKFIL